MACTPVSPSLATLLNQLGPSYLIRQCIDDWFQLVHSVAPILHRREFLSRLEHGHALRDAEFCALVISLCAASVATLRNRSSVNYGTITAEKCWDIIRQNNLLHQRPQFSLEKCLAKYNIATALLASRSVDQPESFTLMAESVAGVKYMLYYDLPTMPFLAQQLLKRLFWLLFAWECSADILVRPTIGVLTAQDNITTLRPLSVTDAELDPSQAIEEPAWHGDYYSYIPGLNHLSDLFLLWHESQQPHNRSADQLLLHLSLVERALDQLPPELRWRGGLSRPPRSNFGTDVQVANLYITQLQIRSNLLEQARNMPGAKVTSMEHQSLVDDLLEILDHMPRDILEANGYSLVPKIRDIGAAFLDEVRMGARQDLVNDKAKRDLEKLLRRLETLDFRPGIGYLNSQCCEENIT
ncbi:hypothetical protein CNMCM5793_004729 [Aspergillus hiratsukae]|uniref:Transcription factor domain-containing protein n=1 Tax=Aspergillus hiratsukae TaxID=1194566 RepID=A0A8H6PFD6_9EURO|nr:hypothetical protein CNMCM5793_004729 [Aspergillus hiratsukae]KAF7170225.1 hypothetical protein CNMCM6106_005003 [Aspergillus hiratsukae]